ncbi:MAG: DEAD/DEAH box helicase family protein [Muribaculaceae bacterium]|nr:DEAD/DEAH box helicase family protein [Muribaculaceae bacterium]
MLKTDVTWPESFRYQTNSEWEPVGFFSEALCNATSFDLMLGFFSSSAINVLSYGFASFIYNGGKMRMIINDILSSDDVSAISMAHEPTELPFFDLQNLEQLSYTLNKRDKHFFECLAWLIRNERIELKIVRMVNRSGIAHTKCGTFSDGKNNIGFEGSVNFSLSAFMHNKESLGVYCDWNGPADVGRINGIQRSFDSAFNGQDKDVEFVETVDLKGYTYNQFQPKGLEELLNDELALIESVEPKGIPETVKTALNKTKSKVRQAIEKIKGIEQEKESEPRFPYPTGPRPYQQQAFDNWKENKQKGLFAMATGTGKTITALNCLLEIFLRKGYYKAIILVPTITLVNQWEKECRKFRFSNIIKVYSKNPTWRDDVERIHFNEKYRTENEQEVSYIIISTYASYSRQKVFNVLNDFDKRKLLIIADECHNIGSESLVKRLKEIPYLRRIGLSATPERQFDDYGNNKLKKFFGSDEKYTFEYSMEEAIKNGVLCKYMYYPHIVRLTTEEMVAYIEISEKISKYFNYNTCTFDNPDDMLKMLLLARKRIIHKAENKLQIFIDIIKRRHEEKGNLKYSLIYVPEGNRPDYIGVADDFDISEDITDDTDADHLINIYTHAVTKVDERVTVKKFISGQKDRDEILDDFASGKLHVLTSMKCLDEGVDVPRSELAIFCSSTGNPRQFIQRRGRVLRTHPDKKLAELHDLIVVPDVSLNSSSFRMEQSLLKGELIRVNNFALLSENPSYSETELREVMNHYGLNLYNNTHIQ